LRLAVKIGGSVAVGEAGPNAEYVSRFDEVVRKANLDRLVVGIGGGKLARRYLQSVLALVSPEQAETLVIELLRANTRFVAHVLGGRPILDERSLRAVSKKTRSRILVVGGIKPGRSTDANTALLAAAIGADLFVKMTDVDGVYTADPHADSSAQLIERMSYDRALDMSVAGTPGSYGILDRMSLQVLKRARIPAVVLNGKDPGTLRKLLDGEKTGTLIG